MTTDIPISTRTPHINVTRARLLQTVFDLTEQDTAHWPEPSRDLALNLAAEAFMVRSNPFVHPEVVKKNVFTALSGQEEHHHRQVLELLTHRLQAFWREQDDLMLLREEIRARLKGHMPEDNIVQFPHSLLQTCTDATGLIVELPLLVLFPEDTAQVQAIVRLANELLFFIVPRGGGSGMTGGALPALRRSVILSLSRFKTIFEVDPSTRRLRAQSGVITVQAAQAAQAKDLLFTVDPASKTASSLGGNIAENAGGPFAFEYGTTLDNIQAYTMVRPTGQVISVQRIDHPEHKIQPEDTAVFEVQDSSGRILDTVSLKGNEIRGKGLGKDVTNKYLKGLPGVQKEGVDGIITEATFVLHPVLQHTQTLCLEFYDFDMQSAVHIIQDLIRLRDRIREQKTTVTMSALEEFDRRYIKAIDYSPKSTNHTGLPASVLLVRLDSDNKRLLEETAWTISDLAQLYPDVEVILAADEAEGERFWEDRHKLSAISKRTNGFKINEDVVIPIQAIPEFSFFLQSLNLETLAQAYSQSLDYAASLHGLNLAREYVDQEKRLCEDILDGHIGPRECPETELEEGIRRFYRRALSLNPEFTQTLTVLVDDLFTNRLEVANHMHAGDGNCHVNIPVHANKQAMVQTAEELVDRIFDRVLTLGGQVSGEHGIGITKIRYLGQSKIDALKAYKERIDPQNIFNPDKLQAGEVATLPFTLSWDRLIEDVAHHTELPNKELLVDQLKHIRSCTRCGKCKQVCPMFYPQKGFLHHPRNKNLSLGAILEALVYTQKTVNIIDPYAMGKLRQLMEYCTACGKCFAICPVKIDSAEVTLQVRSYLEEESQGGHPLKSKVLSYLSREPERMSKAAKAMAWGQNLHNKTVRFIPSFWRRRMNNPVLQGPGPALATHNLQDLLPGNYQEILHPLSSLHLGSERTGVLYFPGCGGGLFFPDIGLAALTLLADCGVYTTLPPQQICCGYPLLAAGCSKTFGSMQERTQKALSTALHQAEKAEITIEAILTSCGTCRAGLEHLDMNTISSRQIPIRDVLQYLHPRLQGQIQNLDQGQNLVYHSSCHAAWANVPQDKAATMYARHVESLAQDQVTVSDYCCAESGLGALTSPHIYNKLRKRKTGALKGLAVKEKTRHLLVSCPSCKIGISRIVRNNKLNMQVEHTLEHLAHRRLGPNWRDLLLTDPTHPAQALPPTAHSAETR
ncbi:MAG: FAD-binding and (Fe-S)-binding domain-containing protein [Desulfovermiculus sp.]|nr:FAD-binding and (Fe-S)-binding domain-containing protein [Desulfovermiculus sp.]